MWGSAHGPRGARKPPKSRVTEKKPLPWLFDDASAIL